jgi:hypothetical protein
VAAASKARVIVPSLHSKSRAQICAKGCPIFDILNKGRGVSTGELRLFPVLTLNSPGDGFRHDSAKAIAILFSCGQGRGRGLNCFQHAGLLMLL